MQRWAANAEVRQMFSDLYGKKPTRNELRQFKTNFQLEIPVTVADGERIRQKLGPTPSIWANLNRPT